MPNKADLVDAISEKADIPKRAAGVALDVMLGEIAEALKKGERVSISGFGTFSLGSRAARTGRNPQTGATIHIPASKTVRFKAGKALKDAVQ
jgi:DNA-binding protein HU-beta